MNTTEATVGALLRDWRQRRHLSQLALATEAEISQRHLSFMESGRAAPSREMILRLATHLAIPLRERNTLLLAAGFAPIYGDRSLDDPALATARDIIQRLLRGHEPYPALAVDRHWQLVMANPAVYRLLADLDPALLAPPVNVLRLSLHPRGLAARVANYRQWRSHLLARLAQQIRNVADPVLMALAEELAAYPPPDNARGQDRSDPEEFAGIAIPLELETAAGKLAFLSTITVFGTPVDIGLSELAIESLFPADEATARAMRGLAEDSPDPGVGFSGFTGKLDPD